MFKECVGWCSVRKQYIRMVFVMCSLCVRYVFVKGKKIPKNYYPTDFCVPVKRHSIVFHSVPLLKRMD